MEVLLSQLKQKQTEQTIHLKESVDLNGIKEQREYLVKQGVDLKTKKANLKKERDEYKQMIADLLSEIRRLQLEEECGCDD